MGISDSISGMVGKAKDALTPDKVDDGIDMAADKVDDMTGHKMSSGIDKGADAAKEAARRMNNKK